MPLGSRPPSVLATRRRSRRQLSDQADPAGVAQSARRRQRHARPHHGGEDGGHPRRQDHHRQSRRRRRPDRRRAGGARRARRLHAADGIGLDALVRADHVAAKFPTIRSRISRRSRCSRSCRTCWWSILRCRCKNVQDLIALAKKAPGALKYASGGVGSTSHFAVAMFVSVAGISKQTLHLPYKGGAPSMIATMSNETSSISGRSPADWVPQIRPGKVEGDRHHRRPALAEPAGCADARGNRACRRGILGLVRADGAGRHARADHRAAPPGVGDRPSTDRDVLKGLRRRASSRQTNSPAEFANATSPTRSSDIARWSRRRI